MLKKFFGLLGHKKGKNDASVYGVTEWTGFVAKDISPDPYAGYADTPVRWKAMWDKIGVEMPCELPDNKTAAVYISGYGIKNHSSLKAGALQVESAGHGAYVAALAFEEMGSFVPPRQGAVWGVCLIPGPYDLLSINGIDAEPVPVPTAASKANKFTRG